MKLLSSLFAAIALLSLTSFSGHKQNKSEIIFQTLTGTVTYQSPTIPARVDELGNLYFEFKPSGYQSVTANQDDIIGKIFMEREYRTVSFRGLVQKSTKNLKAGKSISTFAFGKITYAGTTRGLNIPVTITKLANGSLVYAATALIDWQANPATKALGADLKLQGPIRFTLTPILN